MRQPTVIVPYGGPDSSGRVDDIFLYLRPESNGVLVESTLMTVLRGQKQYRDNAELVYLANLPGDFIMDNHVIEEHYSINYKFAAGGRKCFTPMMKKRFEEHYGVLFDDCDVVGSFDALDLLSLSEEELFSIWVPFEDILFVNGQSVKKYKDLYIINYDIPALLHKNNYATDIAVMVLRSSLSLKDFHRMIVSMEEALVSRGIMDNSKPPSRYFHFSKSPFEQILDGMGYLYTPEGDHLPLENISFTVSLLENGFSMDEIQGIMKYPIMGFEEKGNLIEDNVFIRTRNKTFSEALQILVSAKWQIYIDY
ncbi:hypothetical protein [Spirochaeta isovalerica]|uniref:Uncharacterized protein n=1 Tax=Spirochaeta isovalerica TaxID=150 RepID=A0A841RID1_9SPIO|nr:hypothetical protein [Spirochaeta isovalerica]MBB6482062.1 hypothetical protein [Spirochaeta isovalerica]